ncbi:MAG TPA: hypothetical protein PLW61_02930 [Caldisericia bacterium]|nr:hypothetical protein [Caldisericia bacterium]HQL66991.1 hypothetical protein [Caldisericia bacterium]HQN47950.1 hypothetical protein [Caldisericia bacterium]HQO99876.1 hypothetical protein [Caldisericia bacterium]
MMFQDLTSNINESFSYPYRDFYGKNKLDEWLFIKKYYNEPIFESFEIFQTENSSIGTPSIKVKTETFLYSSEKLLNKISKIIDRLQSEQEIFKDIDKNKVLNKVSKIINESSLNLSDVSDEELIKRIKGILALEAMSGLLKELNREQIEIFNEAVKRRPLFG